MSTVTAVSEHIARLERERHEARVREWNRLHFPQVEQVPVSSDEYPELTADQWATIKEHEPEQTGEVISSVWQWPFDPLPPEEKSLPDDNMTVLKAVVKTLEAMGYTYCGGEMWKPPLGPRPLK